MTIKYHGTPLTPSSVLPTLRGFNFVVSFADPRDLSRLVEGKIANKIMLDSGAYTAWTQGRLVNWNAYYRWVGHWLHFPELWAVIGDVIDGDEKANAKLIREWPHGKRGAPVWHLHESLGKLQQLCAEWPLVCFGSSGQFRRVGSAAWHIRMHEAFDCIAPHGDPSTKLHMLRGMSLTYRQPYPFHSVDSSTVARSYQRDKMSALDAILKWEKRNTPSFWSGGFSLIRRSGIA